MIWALVELWADSMATDRDIPTLISAALELPDDSDERWAHVTTLHYLNSGAALDAAVELCHSAEPSRRELGVDILAQLGTYKSDVSDVVFDRPHRDRVIELLLWMLESEDEPVVLASIGYAFGHQDDPRGVEPLAALSDHPDENVRYAVVWGISRHDLDLAVETLIKLSSDADADVRDWATFGLGTLIERDTPQVREALAARLTDADPDTRDEAIVGLATRGDTRAIEPLLALFADGWEGPLLDESLLALAVHNRDPRLVRPVKDRWEIASNELGFDPQRRIDHEQLFNAALALGLAEGSDPTTRASPNDPLLPD